MQGVSKFDVINLGGVRAWQDKFIEIGNLGPATPNKGARRPRSLRLGGRPTIVHASLLPLDVAAVARERPWFVVVHHHNKWNLHAARK